MDRKFLTDLGLEKEVIDKILDQNGTEITDLKTQIKTKDVEISTLRTDLINANNKVADLSKVDVKDLQTQLANEKAARVKDKQAWSLSSTLAKAGCKDTGYVMYKLSDSVEFDENGAVKDPEALISTVKEAYASQFEAEHPGGTGSIGNFQRSHQTATKQDLTKMSYKERLSLYNQDPQAFQEIVKKDSEKIMAN